MTARMLWGLSGGIVFRILCVKEPIFSGDPPIKQFQAHTRPLSPLMTKSSSDGSRIRVKYSFRMTMAPRVVKNAQYLASSLVQKGFHLAAEKLGFTMSHQLWIDIEPHMDAFDAAVALARCNIIVNACQVPTIANRFALRLGVQEVTYLGANEPEMEAVADIFKEVFIKKDFSEEKIKGRVREIKKGLRLPLDRIWLEKVVSILQS